MLLYLPLRTPIAKWARARYHGGKNPLTGSLRSRSSFFAQTSAAWCRWSRPARLASSGFISVIGTATAQPHAQRKHRQGERRTSREGACSQIQPTNRRSSRSLQFSLVKALVSRCLYCTRLQYRSQNGSSRHGTITRELLQLAPRETRHVAALAPVYRGNSQTSWLRRQRKSMSSVSRTTSARSRGYVLTALNPLQQSV